MEEKWLEETSGTTFESAWDDLVLLHLVLILMFGLDC
jgi:hypothetical protein